MLKITQASFDALTTAAEDRFVERVQAFLESDYPEAGGLDEASARRNARAVIARATQYGLISEEAVLRFGSMLLDYFVHDPGGYAWAHELLSSPDTPEEQKILILEHRLYGVDLWA